MPYFLRSFTRESDVRSPSFFKAFRSSALNSTSARAMPSRTAPDWLFTPLVRVMRAREGAVQSARSLAAQAEERARQATAEFESRTRAARQEVAQQMETARRAANEERTALLESARAEAGATLADARARLQADAADARARLDRDVNDIASAIAERVLGRKTS